MAKKSTIFFCQNCGYESAKWLGQCPACKEWNTLVEETVVTGKAGKSSKKTHNILRQRKTAAEYCELRSWINCISNFDYLKNPDLDV